MTKQNKTANGATRALDSSEIAILERERFEARQRVRELEEFIADAAAFLRFMLYEREASAAEILPTLVHDIGGLANAHKCFSPRVTGYAEREIVCQLTPGAKA